jgi:hypothetical protein
MRCETEVHFSKRGAIMQPQSLSSRRPCCAKLFANGGGRVANPFDCARQLIFANAKMPGPIFNMVLMLDNDFAAVRSCFTDHLFDAPAYAESKQGRVGLVPHYTLGRGDRTFRQGEGHRRQGDRRLICQKQMVSVFRGQSSGAWRPGCAPAGRRPQQQNVVLISQFTSFSCSARPSMLRCLLLAQSGRGKFMSTRPNTARGQQRLPRVLLTAKQFEFMRAKWFDRSSKAPATSQYSPRSFAPRRRRSCTGKPQNANAYI